MNIRTLSFTFLLVMVLSAFPTSSSAKYKCVPKVYMFGFAQSLKDSTVYLTDILEIDNAWVDEKTKFLYQRDGYSLQLKNYIFQDDKQEMYIVTLFALNRKQIEKKYAKLKQKYSSNRNHYIIKFINENEMHYNAIEFDNEDIIPEKSSKKNK
jgi:hypothetical protein